MGEFSRSREAADSGMAAVHWWSRIWKKNPNLESIFEIPFAARADFAIWNCRIAGRRGEIDLDSCQWAVVSCQLSVDCGQWSVGSG
jgi:hypothetical protein